MPTYASSRLDRVFVQANTDLRTIPNSSGTWTNTGSILTRHASFTATQNNSVSERPDKTGTRSALKGIPGRKSGSFSFSAPLIPNGAAGVAPDLAPVLASIFGQAGTVVAATSVTYSFLDTGFLPFSFLRFNRDGDGSATHIIAGGCVPQRVTIAMGGEYLILSVDGQCVFVSDSVQFPSYTGADAVAKFGLSAWPAEPTSGGPLTVNGTPIAGFYGTATFDGNTEADLRGTPVITINTGLELVGDGFADPYPFAVVGGKRSVSVGSIKCIDNSGSAVSNLKTKALTKSAINISTALNNVAGSTITCNIGGVQLAPWQLVENGAAFDVNFGESMAHASAIGAVDDFSLVFS